LRRMTASLWALSLWLTARSISMLHSGDIRPESRSALYPLIVVYKPFDRTFEVMDASGLTRATGFASYDEAVVFALQA
jgi:hypothetical protein